MKPEIPETWLELTKMMDKIRNGGNDFLRLKSDEEEYQNSFKILPKEERLKRLNRQIGRQGPKILNNLFPYSNLLSKMPWVKHYCLWNKSGAMNKDEIKKVVEEKFKNRRWCWMERVPEGKTVPEIWHVHIFVEER